MANSEELYSVYQDFPDGRSECVRKHVEGKEAVKAFNHYTTSVGARIGTTVRVIIVDMLDCINMEWTYEDGIVYPPNLKGLHKKGIAR